MLVTVMRLVDNEDLVGKIIAVILNQGRVGQQVAIKLLEEHSGLKRQNIVHSALYYPGLVRRVIIPMLIEELQDKSLAPSRRNQAAALLSRLGILLESDIWAELISNSFLRQLADPALLASTLVNGGQSGKKEFLALMKSSSQPKLTAVLCMYMREMRLDPVLPTLVIKTKERISQSQDESKPRHSWHFEGESFARMQNTPPGMRFPQEPFMSLTPQEAEALVRKFLLVPADDHYQRMCHFEGREKLLLAYAALLNGARVSDSKKLPKQIVAVLVDKLEDEDPTVAEAALNSLGTIGLPSIEQFLPKIEKCLLDKNVRVRAMAVWAIGSFGENLGRKQFDMILNLLDDSHMQVRTSACVTLSQIGSIAPEEAICKLLRCLKDGRLNRDTICETIMTFKEGSEVLLEASKTHKSSHHILKAIISSWKSVNPDDPLAETLVREVLDLCR